MKITLGQSYSFYQQGRRDYQEDSRYPDTDKPSVSQRFFVVCDGVGGSEKGEIASRIVCDAIAKKMHQMNLDIDFSSSEFAKVLDAAYDALDRKADRYCREMATTLTFACFHGEGCTLAHIGDSRIYHLRKGQGIIYRSEDHSLVNSMVRNGLLTPDEAIDSPKKHVITRYMEPVDSDQNRCMATVMYTKNVCKGDYFLLCTDGVCNQIDDDEMVDLISDTDMSDEKKMMTLAQICRDSDDNNTAVLIPIIDVLEDFRQTDSTTWTNETKKIVFHDGMIEEVESIQRSKDMGFLNWIKQTKVVDAMKKMFLTSMLTFCALTMLYAAPATNNRNQARVEEFDSIALMIDKADEGDAKAQNTVGVWYYTGKGTLRQNYQKALQYWALSAKQDNIDAIGNMAMCYQLGHGTEKDSAMAVNLYKVALKKGSKTIIPQHEAIVKNTGSLFSCLLLKECYQAGIGIGKNVQKYVYYMEKAAEKGSVTSQYELALYYLNNQQADKAVAWFRRAAQQNEVGAIYYYGYLKFNGQGIVQDKVGGINLFHRAAEMGFTMADYQLGKIYYEGNGIEKNYEKAVVFLRKAAEKGEAKAKWLLGLCYLDGNGVRQDYYFATQWLANAAPSHQKELRQLLEGDNEGTFTQYLYGLRYYYLDKDYDTALSHFKKVYKAKNVEGRTMQAVCYGNQNYAKHNMKKAVKWLNKVTDKSVVADYYLSVMLETGVGTKMDVNHSLVLLEKAANNGVAYAQCKLGDKYMEGNGITKDITKAAQLYLQAEVQECLTTTAARNLAECYAKKVSILPDLENADKRMEQLRKYKQMDNIITMLKLMN